MYAVPVVESSASSEGGMAHEVVLRETTLRDRDVPEGTAPMEIRRCGVWQPIAYRGDKQRSGLVWSGVRIIVQKSRQTLSSVKASKRQGGSRVPNAPSAPNVGGNRRGALGGTAPARLRSPRPDVLLQVNPLSHSLQTGRYLATPCRQPLVCSRAVVHLA